MMNVEKIIKEVHIIYNHITHRIVPDVTYKLINFDVEENCVLTYKMAYHIK